MQVLVTGSTGFIGSHLVEQLLALDCRVKCLVRKTSDLKWLKGLAVKYVYGDLNDESSLREAVHDCEVIFHLGGLTKARNAAAYDRVNAESCRLLFEACLQYNKNIRKIVFVSSLAAAGPSSKQRPRSEVDKANPLTLYGLSKYKGEQYARQYADRLPIIIISPPAVYGPRESDIYFYFKLINSHIKPVLGFQKKYLSLIFVKDLVDAMILASKDQKGIGEHYFIEDGQIYSWRDVANTIKTTLNRWTLTVVVPQFLVIVIAYIAEFTARLTGSVALLNKQKIIELKQEAWTVTSAKFRTEFDYSPKYDFEQGCRETANWYINEGWL